MPHQENMWKSEADKARLHGYWVNTQLYKGDFQKVWKDLKPLNQEFPVIVMNDAKNITDAIANLLFRETPDFKAETVPASQSNLDDLVKNTRFTSLLKKQATWGSVLGDSVFLSRHDGEQVQIEFVHPKFFFGIFG